MTRKVRLKMKNRLHRYDISRPRPRNGLSIMMVICIKQHLSNI